MASKAEHFAIRVIDGDLAPFSAAQLKRSLQRLGDGVFQVEIRAPRRKKSQDALGYLFAVVFPMIAAEIGCTVPEIKEELEWELGRKVVPRASGKGFYWTTGAISEMDAEELRTFIDAVIRWAAEFLHIVIPEADPDWRWRTDKAKT